MNSYYYYCDFPTEINGSHWHCEWGGFAIQAVGGVSIMMFSAGISGNVGGLTGSCTWRCPNLTMAAPPNPPGAWKDYVAPTRCKTVGPNPDVEAPPPVPPPPTSEPPPPPPVAPGPPLADLLPSVTNPRCSNPNATNNNGCG